MVFKHFDNLEQKTTNSNLERGKTYRITDAIKNFQCVNNRYFSAVVKGQKNYRALIEVGKKDFRAWCSCPYDSRGLCKHEVALALEIRKNKTGVFRSFKKPAKQAFLTHRLKISMLYILHLRNKLF